MLIFSWFSLSHATLIANDLGSPQDLVNASAVDLCANRSSFCNVLIDVPSKCAGTQTNCPVLFCLHGFGGSNRKYIELCGSEVHAQGFIGVYPQGDPLAGNDSHPKGFGWNDGMAVNQNNTRLRCKYNNYTCSLDPNDTLFFEEIIRALRVLGANGNLYAFGQSNGADWVQRLAVNTGPSLPFVGIAPQSGQLNAHPPRSAAGPLNYNQPIPNRPRVAQLSIHGTADRTIPYAGGPKFNSKIFIMFSEPASNKVSNTLTQNLINNRSLGVLASLFRAPHFDLYRHPSSLAGMGDAQWLHRASHIDQRHRLVWPGWPDRHRDPLHVRALSERLPGGVVRHPWRRPCRDHHVGWTADLTCSVELFLSSRERAEKRIAFIRLRMCVCVCVTQILSE